MKNPLDLVSAFLDRAIGTGARAAKLAAALPGVAATEKAIGRAVHGRGPVPTDTALEPAAVKASIAVAGAAETQPKSSIASVPSSPPPTQPALSSQRLNAIGQQLLQRTNPAWSTGYTASAPAQVPKGKPTIVYEPPNGPATSLDDQGITAFAGGTVGAGFAGSIPLSAPQVQPVIPSAGAASSAVLEVST